MPIPLSKKRSRILPKSQRARAPKRRSRLPLSFNDPTLDATEMKPRFSCWDASHVHRGPSGDRDYAAEDRMDKAFRRMMFKLPPEDLPPGGRPVTTSTKRKRQSR